MPDAGRFPFNGEERGVTAALKAGRISWRMKFDVASPGSGGRTDSASRRSMR